VGVPGAFVVGREAFVSVVGEGVFFGGIAGVALRSLKSPTRGGGIGECDCFSGGTISVHG
jgi:Zn-dependent metalloprotease